MKHAVIGAVLLSSSLAAWAQDQQLGARTKAMGGSYTAFEDDPVSVWLNPAGIASQPDAMSIAYQTYTAYPKGLERAPNDTVAFSTKATNVQGDPALLPSYLGFVFQMGTPEEPMAVGLCYAAPYLLDFAMDQVKDPNQVTFEPEAEVQQSLSRFRVCLAKDFVFKERGTAGMFGHLSVGGGLDLGVEKWQFSGLGEDTTNTATSWGFGIGLLAGLYDNGDTFRCNVGLAYSSRVAYDFKIDPNVFPAFNMPQQLNLGSTFYIGEGFPLRATVDFQWIEWSATAADPIYPNFDGFDDAINVSMGFEYRYKYSDKVNLYPRLGYRRFDAPWGDKNDLPMTGVFRLVLDTKAEVFNLVTFGVGIGWTSETGKLRSVDIASDLGGDAYNIATGFTMEF